MNLCKKTRGVKRLETKIRNEKARYLLNVDGETCHTVNNCSIPICELFLKHLEILCDKMYFYLKRTYKITSIMLPILCDVSVREFLKNIRSRQSVDRFYYLP